MMAEKLLIIVTRINAESGSQLDEFITKFGFDHQKTEELIYSKSFDLLIINGPLLNQHFQIENGLITEASFRRVLSEIIGDWLSLKNYSRVGIIGHYPYFSTVDPDNLENIIFKCSYSETEGEFYSEIFEPFTEVIARQNSKPAVENAILSVWNYYTNRASLELRLELLHLLRSHSSIKKGYNRIGELLAELDISAEVIEFIDEMQEINSSFSNKYISKLALIRDILLD